MEVEVKNKNKINAKRKDIYFSKMKEIDFMADYVNDPEIFNVNSMQCKLFLIKSFTALNVNFHYLSLVGVDSIDQEIAKAANILQLTETRPETKQLFQGMSEMEIHRFWMRFFYLCKIQNSIAHSNSIDNSKTDEKFFSTFSVMKTALQHVNYDISVVNTKKLQEFNVDEEINSWTNLPDNGEQNCGDHIVRNNVVEKSKITIDLKKFTSDVNYITKKVDLKDSEIKKPTYHNVDFYKCFNEAVQEIFAFKNNIDVICSFSAQNLINSTTAFQGTKMLLNNCQIKRCNDMYKNIILLKQKLCRG